MEFEFDKEIDALLRKAGKDGEAKAPVLDSHLDADEISMFAENATPEAARTRTISHLADCDRCRSILSNVIALNLEDPVSDQSAVPLPLEVGNEQTSWLSNLFSTRKLALGFGTLALLFVGIIGFGVIRNMGPGETQLAQADQNEVSKSAQKVGDTAANANAASPVAEAADAQDSNAEAPASDQLEGAQEPLTIAKNDMTTGKDVARRQERDIDGFSGSRSDLGRLRDAEDNKAPLEAREELSDKSVVAETKPAASEALPPPAPSPKKSVLTKRGAVEKKKEVEQAEVAAADAATGAASTVGAKRQISGKNFDRRNGIWYDSAYRNQPTTSIKRGTAEFRNLDAGVRAIADQLAGTVVVVWKTKTYKIQ